MIRVLSDPVSNRFLWITLVIGASASVLLSIWSITIDSVINNDGIEYVRTAEFLSIGNWRAAFETWKWPFYPFLMMLVGDVAGISYEWSGHALNTIFFSLAVVFFVVVVREFGGSSRWITLIAMVVALIHPAFNEYRAFLIRDPGYLAAYLLAIYYLTKYRQQPCLRYRSGVIGSLFVASLFRIEGLVFLFFTPILFSLVSRHTGKQHWTRLLFSILAVAILAAVLGWWLLVPTTELNALSLIKDPIDVLSAGWHQIGTRIDEKLEVLRKVFLGPYSAGHANTLYGLAVVMVIATSILSELSIPYAALTMYAVLGRTFPRDDALNKLWLALILINIAILLAFTMIMVFLAPRYPLAITITLLIAVPFALDKLTKHVRKHRLKKVWWLVVAILALWAVGEGYSGVTNFSRDHYLREAGYWLHEMTEDTSGPILTNNRKIAYYTDVGGNREVLIISRDHFIGSLKQLTREHGSDFAGILIQRSENLIEQTLSETVGSRPAKVFSNKRGDRVLLYDLRY